jgi:phage-related protein
MAEAPKPLVWIKPSKQEFKAFPRTVQRDLGHALDRVQHGLKPAQAKALKGFKGAGVLELVEDHDGNTFRAVYTVRLAGRVYMLHAFQKKSKKGIKTPKHVIELIRARLREAERVHAEWEGRK